MDLLLRWGLQGADLEVKDGDLAVDESLVTPVLVSLFTDGRTPRGPSGAPALQDLRGWWAEEATDPFGSLLWTLSREKVTDEVLERARVQAADSLRWLSRQGIAASVTVTSSRIERTVLGLDVQLKRGASSRWAPLWDATESFELTTGGILLDLSAR